MPDLALTIVLCLLAVVATVNFVICVMLMGMALWQRLQSSIGTRRYSTTISANGGAPAATKAFVSIHIAVHDEPADLVIETLNAIHSLNYDHFEVILIDNNSPYKETWLPVRAHMSKLGTNFRFFAVQNLKGAKAGALNLARTYTDPRSEFIAIVDADYQIYPDFLKIAVANCRRVDFVQFPQAYRNSAGCTSVTSELSNYFAHFPKRANRFGTALPTGTLSLIRTSALDTVGCWPTTSITEDAELGVALWRAGAKGLFVDEIVGRGLLPTDLAGLRLQRSRWVAGNIQSLTNWFKDTNKLPYGSLSVFGQLTAWPAFLALPITILIFSLVVRLTNPEQITPLLQLTEYLAMATIIATFVRLTLNTFSAGIGSTAVKISLIWTSSFAWWPVLWGRRLRFRRTPKMASMTGRKMSVDDVGSVAALLLAAGFAFVGQPLTSALLALTASSLLTSPFIDGQLRHAAASQGL